MASADFTRWATRSALVACLYAWSAACSSDSAHRSVQTPGDAGSDSSGGDDGVGGTGDPNPGSPSDAGDGGSNGSDLVPGVWNETTWNEARWQ